MLDQVVLGLVVLDLVVLGAWVLEKFSLSVQRYKPKEDEPNRNHAHIPGG